MWIFSQHGFFSAVRDGARVSVRARVKVDLENLNGLLADLGEPSSEIVELPGRDYPYRVYLTPDVFSRVVLLMSQRVSYSNFKDHVKKVAGAARAKLYSQVWGVMYGAESKV